MEKQIKKATNTSPKKQMIFFISIIAISVIAFITALFISEILGLILSILVVILSVFLLFNTNLKYKSVPIILSLCFLIIEFLGIYFINYYEAETNYLSSDSPEYLSSLSEHLRQEKSINGKLGYVIESCQYSNSDLNQSGNSFEKHLSEKDEKTLDILDKIIT